MKKILTLLMAIILLFNYATIIYAEAATESYGISIKVEEDFQPTNPPYVTAQGAVLIEQSTGKVLYDSDAYKKLYPASTTKVLTALVAIEEGNLDDLVTVGEEVLMIPYDSSIAGLFVDEEITLRDLLFGLMVNSGNDAAMTIAVHIARSKKGNDLSTNEAIDYFAGLMNERAKAAGAKNSNFVNPHGYHDPDHYTTAYDLAMITRQAMQYEFFRELTSTISMETKYWHNKQPRYWSNKNRLINKYYNEYYEYATGGKTGWTTPAGSCLVSTATNDNMDLIAVVMKSEHSKQWSDTVSLFDYGFHNFMPYQLLKRGSIYKSIEVTNIDDNDTGMLSLEINEDYTGIFHKNDLDDIGESVVWNEDLLSDKANDNSTVLTAQIYKGQIVGELILTLKDEPIARSYLTASRDVQKKLLIKEGGRLIKNNEIFDYGRYVLIVVAAAICIKIISLIFKGVRRRKSSYIFKR